MRFKVLIAIMLWSSAALSAQTSVPADQELVRDVAAPAVELVDGPLRSASEIQAFEILGLRLGMPLDEARRVLERQGFALRHPETRPVADTSGKWMGGVGHYWGKQPPEPTREEWEAQIERARRTGEPIETSSGPTNIVGLGYVVLDGGPARLVRISYTEPLTHAQAREPDAIRADLLRRYGTPTKWQKRLNNGYIADEMFFAASRDLADEWKLNAMSSCLIDWKNARLCDGTDCRQAVAIAQAPTLHVWFSGGIVQELNDFAAQRASVERDPKFARQDASGEECQSYPIH